ncbi:MAG: DUF815 domain-containing protein, partial [Gammaproteobacteria bacterium]
MNSTQAIWNWEQQPRVRLSGLAQNPEIQPLEPVSPLSEAGHIGLSPQRGLLYDNLRQHLCAFPANHTLVYGPRGCGKSSLCLSVLNQLASEGLKIVQTDVSALLTHGAWLDSQRHAGHRFVLLLDDLGFEETHSDTFRALKSFLQGGGYSLPECFLLCATANRRHLLAETSNELQRQNDLHPDESAEELLAMADRFGLWIRLHRPDQEQYLQIVEHWLT